MGSQVRLQKYIADCGVTSRRKAENLIVQGKVEVNGKLAIQLGTKVDPENDVVLVDGKAIDLNSVQNCYVVMNKPRGVMTTVSDPEGRPTVMDFVKNISERVYPVGRLDYLSEGLLILTNDGELANQIIHPRYNVVKVYEVKVFGVVTQALLKKLRNGVLLPDGLLKPASVRIIKTLPQKTWLEVRLNEGKNREIRRICEAVGLTVDKLKRVAIGGLTVDNLAPGKYHLISKKELMKRISQTAGDSNTGPYRSQKRSKKPTDSKRVFNKADKDQTADNTFFYRYRKESYYQTMDFNKNLNCRK